MNLKIGKGMGSGQTWAGLGVTGVGRLREGMDGMHWILFPTIHHPYPLSPRTCTSEFARADPRRPVVEWEAYKGVIGEGSY